MALNHEFFRIFGVYFDVDLLEPGNIQQIQTEAAHCASHLNNQIVELPTLIQDLSEFVDELDLEAMKRFVEVTNVDWFIDEESKKLLKDIVSEIIKNLKIIQSRELSS
jgi:hypothetical protein